MFDSLFGSLFGRTSGGKDAVPEQIHMGAGVVALTTGAAIAAFAALAAIGWALRDIPTVALGGMVIVAGLAVYFLRGTWAFADKHQDLAAMGGSWWFRLREIQLSAKDSPPIIDASPIPDPLQPTPPASEPLPAPDRTLRIEDK